MTPSGAVTPTPVPGQRDSGRDYLLEMIEQLARLARRTGDLDVAIHLKAILDAARVADRKHSA